MGSSVTGPEIGFDPRLMRDVVDRECYARQSRGDLSFFAEFYALYESVPALQRPEAFGRLTQRLFATLGLDQVVRSILGQHPTVSGGIRRVIVRPTNEEEIADLLERDGARDLVIDVRATTLLDKTAFARLLEFEVWHVQDLLDPGFGYRREGLGSLPPSIRNLVGQRYRALWKITIENRLLLAGRQDLVDRVRRRAEFDRLYPSLEPTIRDRIFAALCRIQSPSHAQLLAIASGIKALFAFAGVDAEARDTQLPGSPCPLCRFPTFQWADASRAPAAAIRRDYPEWVPEAGLCSRCEEVYLIRV